MIKIFLDNETKTKIENEYWNWFSSKHLNRFKKKRIKKEVKLALFGKESINDIDIKEFLLAPPYKLQMIKEKIDKLEDTYKINSLTFAHMMRHIYRDYRNNMARKIVRELEIHICPYCNQNYVFSYDEETCVFCGELDHFYPKSKYFLLQVCLYNMIPVCSTCNHIKKDNSLVINNPFDGNYNNDFRFKADLELEDCFDFMKLQSRKINIDIDDSLAKESYKNEIKLFKLDERYRGLKDEALMTIIRTNMYNEFYQKTLTGLGIDSSDLKGIIVGYSEDDNRVSLSKFNRDIMAQFDLDE